MTLMPESVVAEQPLAETETETEPQPQPEPQPTGRGRVGAAIRESILTVAAIAGAVCIVLTILALCFHVTLIMFKTGSMSPTIPTGSLAVVREIPAGEARVGDVVTVDRPGELPVTHRVVATTPGSGGTTVLTLKGDANPVDDPAPYPVSTVRIVLWSVPGLAYFVASLGNPLVMGGITLAVAALVTWVFWPKPTASDRPRPPGRHGRAPVADA
jgi:signal peptidase